MATYFIDKSGGDDTKDGLTEANAWEFSPSMPSASGVSDGTTLAAGDFVLFKRGETWREQLLPGSSGSAGNPITYSVYGTGNQPIFKNSDVVTTWVQYLATNVYSVTVTGDETSQVFEDEARLTEVTWDTNIATTAAAMSAGTWSIDIANDLLYVWATDGTDPDTHTMEVCKRTGSDIYCILLIDQSYIVVDNLALLQATKGNLRINTTVGVNISNITVKNCTIIYAGFIRSTSSPGQGLVVRNDANVNEDFPITDIVFDNNTISRIQGHGIQVRGNMEDVTISNNTVSFCGEWQKDTTGHHGITAIRITAAAPPKRITIEKNTVFNCFIGTNDNEGTGIQLDDNTEDSTIRYNLCHDNEGTGIIANSTNGTCEIYYNICYGNGGGDASNILGGLWFGGNENLNIYNNVCHNNAGSGVNFGSVASAGTINLKNNIFSENDTKEMSSVNAGSVSGLDSNNNCVYHPAGGTFMNWQGTDYNWADYLTNSSQDSSSINSNPLFVDAANNDFNLESSSPCRNRGADVGLQSDFDGRQVHQPPDIGTYEITGKLTPLRKLIYLRK